MQPRSARDDPGSQTLDGSSAAGERSSRTDGASESARAARARDALALLVLAAAVLAVYLPLGLFTPGHTLKGIDFESLHDRRIAFVQEAFARDGLRLPGWYPRELMGTP